MHPGPWWIVSLVSARENPSNVAAFGGDRPLAQKTGSAQTCGRESKNFSVLQEQLQEKL